MHTHTRVPGSKKKYNIKRTSWRILGVGRDMRPVDIVEGWVWINGKRELMRREQTNSGYTVGRCGATHQDRNMANMI